MVDPGWPWSGSVAACADVFKPASTPAVVTAIVTAARVRRSGGAIEASLLGVGRRYFALPTGYQVPACLRYRSIRQFMRRPALAIAIGAVPGAAPDATL